LSRNGRGADQAMITGTICDIGTRGKQQWLKE
jgi:hypothetical protein